MEWRSCQTTQRSLLLSDYCCSSHQTYAGSCAAARLGEDAQSCDTLSVVPAWQVKTSTCLAEYLQEGTGYCKQQRALVDDSGPFGDVLSALFESPMRCS
eukprot:430016-Amphidinium_carterae.1